MSAITILLSEFAAKTYHGARVIGLRVGRQFPGRPIAPGFFDQYPVFFESSETTAFPNRLNERYRACIEWNRPIIDGRKVLDIASHDGRWSFAALKAGASHVTGIEMRSHLVENARANLHAHGAPDGAFKFIQANANKALEDIEPGSIDTVFCFGFFYHITDHMLMLSNIARIRPKNIVIDTAVTPDPRSVVLFQKEDPDNESDAARTDDAQMTVLAGIPSRAALELMLSSFGWKADFYDWQSAGIRNWKHIEDYQERTRVTVRVTCGSRPASNA